MEAPGEDLHTGWAVHSGFPTFFWAVRPPHSISYTSAPCHVYRCSTPSLGKCQVVANRVRFWMTFPPSCCVLSGFCQLASSLGLVVMAGPWLTANMLTSLSHRCSLVTVVPVAELHCFALVFLHKTPLSNIWTSRHFDQVLFTSISALGSYQRAVLTRVSFCVCIFKCLAQPVKPLLATVSMLDELVPLVPSWQPQQKHFWPHSRPCVTRACLRSEHIAISFWG